MGSVFSFAQVSQALAAVHGVADTRLPAFQARLKHYQKMGYPKGINTGRGRAASYDIGHVVQLALVLEANQMGLSPERARYVIQWNMDRAKTAIGLSLHSKLAGGDPLPTFLTFDPNGLDDLRDADATDAADETFHYAGLGQLVENIQRWAGEGVPRFAVVNLSEMLDRLSIALTALSEKTEDEILGEADAWASVHNDDDTEA